MSVPPDKWGVMSELFEVFARPDSRPLDMTIVEFEEVRGAMGR